MVTEPLKPKIEIFCVFSLNIYQNSLTYCMHVYVYVCVYICLFVIGILLYWFSHAAGLAISRKLANLVPETLDIQKW